MIACTGYVKFPLGHAVMNQGRRPGLRQIRLGSWPGPRLDVLMEIGFHSEIACRLAYILMFWNTLILEVCGKDYFCSHSHKTIPIPTHSHDKNLFPFPFFPDTTIPDYHSHCRHEIFRNTESQEIG